MSDFHSWVVENGGEVLAITNPYEFARIKAEGQTHVIYTGRKGLSFSSDDAAKIYAAFNKKQKRKLSERPSKYKKSQKDVDALIKRDGDRCFFCLSPFTKTNPSTLEHLVARRHGGPDHMSNYVLAHEECGRQAGTLSVAEKVLIRESNLLEANHE